MKSPANNAAMKLATPLVPKRPCVVAVRMPLRTSPGAIYPENMRSYSSKKSPRLNNITSFQMERVAGKRSSRAEMRAPPSAISSARLPADAPAPEGKPRAPASPTAVAYTA